MVGGDRTSQAQGGAGGGKREGHHHKHNTALTMLSHLAAISIISITVLSTILLMYMTIQMILLAKQGILDPRGLNKYPKHNISVPNFKISIVEVLLLLSVGSYRDQHSGSPASCILLCHTNHLHIFPPTSINHLFGLHLLFLPINSSLNTDVPQPTLTTDHNVVCKQWCPRGLHSGLIYQPTYHYCRQ